MIKNFLKTAIRNLLKNKVYSSINILGLAIGIACSVLIYIFVRFELSYDNYHEKADRIYRVAVRASIGDTKIHQTYSSAITFLKLLEEFPEIETGVKFLNLGRVPVLLDEKSFYEDRFFAVDSTFFDIFTVPLVHGDPSSVLAEPNTMVITETTALKYFGDTDVVGRVLTANFTYDPGRIDFRISGVSKDMPENSHFHYDLLASSTTFPRYLNDTGWTANNFISYVVLVEGTSQQAVEEKLKEFTRKYMGGDEFDAWVAQGNYWQYFLQPVTDIHLNSDLNGEFEANGDKLYVTIFSAVSLFILLIACINFMNLATARSSLRAKEVGIRKVVGSSRRILVSQFLTESVILVIFSMAAAIVIVELLLPGYRNLVGRDIGIHYFDNPWVLPSLLALALAVGVLSGSYPAFLLSAFTPASVLKGDVGDSKSGVWIRNGLILFQFTISTFLIIGTILIYQQLRYFQEVKLGFDKEQVLLVRNPGALGDRVTVFKDILRGKNGIEAVSGSNTVPGKGFSNWGFGAEGVEENFTLNACVCDYDFLKTMKLELIKGRFFSREFKSDSSAAILNEKALKLLGWDDPLGKKINNWAQNRGNFTVIGVIEDYHYESLHQEIRPMALFLSGGYYTHTEQYISVRLRADRVPETLAEVEAAWNEFAPQMPFEYSFLDLDFDNLYMNEKRTRQLFLLFSALAIFIACLGLLGLASFIADRKTKEIGVRKVLGASIAGIVGRLNLTFTKWVLLSNLLAWPLAWFFMNGWLQNFPYRIEIRIWIFFAAGLLALAIALLTVSYQAIKAALANPAESLRNE